jgi:hypothetical protein
MDNNNKVGFISHIMERTWAEDVQEQGSVEAIWTKEGEVTGGWRKLHGKTNDLYYNDKMKEDEMDGTCGMH